MLNAAQSAPWEQRRFGMAQGGNFPERRWRGRQRSMGLKVCFSMKLLFKLACWHISQHIMGNYQRIGVGAGPVSCGEVTNQSTQCSLSLTFLCSSLFQPLSCLFTDWYCISRRIAWAWACRVANLQNVRNKWNAALGIWVVGSTINQTKENRDGGVNQHKRASLTHFFAFFSLTSWFMAPVKQNLSWFFLQPLSKLSPWLFGVFWYLQQLFNSPD